MKKSETEKEEAKLPAVREDQGGVPAGLADIAGQIAEDSGKGLSSSQDDNIVPLIYILQSQSPQAVPDEPEYIDGAVAGDIWLRNSTDPIAKDGIWFQPCWFFRDYVEWRPESKGGGIVDRHAAIPQDVTEVPDQKNENKIHLIRPNGNEIVDTRYHAGFVLGRGAPMPYVIPLKSTGHTFSRSFMFMMNSRMLPGQDKPAPSFASKYLLKTRKRENASGKWYVFDVAEAAWVDTAADYQRGRALFQSFAAGEKKLDEAAAEVPEEGDAAEQTGF